jgi:hypothetical protein
MWISPNHPNPPRPPSAPRDDGQALGSFPRGDGRDELRVTLKTYEGRPYVSLRVWSRDDHGQWWPQKAKGVSVRLGEVSGVIGSLQGAVAAAGEIDRQAGRGRAAEPAPRADRGRRDRPPWDADQLRGGKPAEGFDEFSEDGL